ncbi:MAG: hypothetical protein R2724_21425 [Bryobacterales bacterium]
MKLYTLILAAVAFAANVQAQLTVVSPQATTRFRSRSRFDRQRIWSEFGAEAATTAPLPTVLQGVRVTITDGALQTKDCPLFFVSPTQINFLLPDGLAEGPGFIRLRAAAALGEEGAEQVLQEGTITIANVAQGLFFQTDLEWLAGFLVRVAADGTQTRESIYHAVNGEIVPRVLELSPGGDESEQFYLEGYGTGFRNVGGVDSVVVAVGNATSQNGFTQFDRVPVLYVGPAPGFDGLDQFTVGPLSRRLEYFGGTDAPVALFTQERSSNVAWMQIAPNPNAPVVSNLDFQNAPGALRYQFDFSDADGDLGAGAMVVTIEDAGGFCTSIIQLPPATFNGRTSGRADFQLAKGQGRQLTGVLGAVVSISDGADHISNTTSWEPAMPGALSDYVESCQVYEPK